MIQRVQKIISNSGFCSRRKAEELIKEGRVKVNNKIISVGESADTDKDRIFIDDELLKKQKKMYIMLNKPEGYHSTIHDQFGRKTILKLVPIKERVYPVGRLDADSRGLILLTNDGDFANKVMHPRNKVRKTYIALLDKKIKKEDLVKLNGRIRLIDGKVDMKVEKLDKKLIKITITEGRKHLVKRALFKHGYYVKDLKRIAIEKLILDVKDGKWRFLNEEDLKKIFKK
ncbi:MAG: pseudouridine synthase [Candidatus Woesearchaeota archaeon]